MTYLQFITHDYNPLKSHLRHEGTLKHKFVTVYQKKHAVMVVGWWRGCCSGGEGLFMDSQG